MELLHKLNFRLKSVINGDIMRVIAGELKGRSLQSVPGKGTRPTTDKVKESIFNIIGPFFEGGICLDLFAGSGALGIEALSRGMDYAIFIDKNFQAIKTINKNIEALGLEEKSEIYRTDALRALRVLQKRDMRMDYIFIDPPYNQQNIEVLLIQIVEKQLLNPQGIIVCEHSSDLQLPNSIGNIQVVKNGVYGITGITIYQAFL